MASLKKQYEFGPCITTNAFADVYFAHEQIHGQRTREVVVKVLKSNWQENQESVAILQEDMELLGQIHHPNVPRIYEITAIRGRIAIVSEWISGIDLRSMIDAMRNMKQRIPLKVSLEMVGIIANTLDVVYNHPPVPGKGPLRVLHGNIKPNNIMLSEHGQVSVLDFGMLHSELGGRESSTREMQYDTIEYVAPEKLFFEPQTPASDIYSLTVTLFEMLAGQSFGKAPPSEEQHQAKVEKYCQHLLRPMPLGIEIKEELLQLLTGGLSYASEQRPDADIFAEKALNISRSIKGLDTAQWGPKAVVYFQKKKVNSLKGLLEGTVLGEDTQIYEKHKNETVDKDKHIVDDIDTAIIRRGAMADFVEASLDLAPEFTHSLSLDNSVIVAEDFSADIPLPPNIPHNSGSFTPRAPIVQGHFDDTTSPSMAADSYNRSHTLPSQDIPLNTDKIRKQLEVTSQEMPVHSTGEHAPVQIKPQSMVMPIVESMDSGSSKMAYWLIGGTAGIVFLLIVGLLFLGGDTSNKPESTKMSNTTPSTPTTNATADTWEGTKFTSVVRDTTKMKVKCGSETQKAEKGSTFVVIQPPESSCFVEVRSDSKGILRVDVSDVKDGLYTCSAQDNALSCVLESK